MDFHEISYLSIFRKSLWKIHLLLKASKDKGHLAWRLMYVYDNIFLNSSQNWNVSENVVEKIKTHILYSTTFSKNLTIYEIMWKNIVQSWQATDDNIMAETMPFACWITQAADTHSEYVVLVALSRQQLLSESACIWITHMFPALFIIDLTLYSVTLEEVSHKNEAADK